jgi:hypothetical protein
MKEVNPKGGGSGINSSGGSGSSGGSSGGGLGSSINPKNDDQSGPPS